MGCDIHCHVEVKINGRWEHWSAPNVGRDYSLFSRMAGVRAGSDGPAPIAEPRGLVPDPSIPTEIDWRVGDGDWHTPSWLTGEELEDLIEERRPKRPDAAYGHAWQPWARGGFPYLFGCPLDVKRQIARDGRDAGYPDGVEDCRLVFWFDN